VTTRSANTAWASDVFDNAVATVTFQASTDRLVIDSMTRLELDAAR
jgi:hypothetical protein